MLFRKSENKYGKQTEICFAREKEDPLLFIPNLIDYISRKKKYDQRRKDLDKNGGFVRSH